MNFLKEELRMKCNKMESGVFMFMNKLQKNEKLKYDDLYTFLTDVEELSEEEEINLINNKIKRLQRNWNLLFKRYKNCENSQPLVNQCLDMVSKKLNSIIVNTDSKLIVDNFDDSEVKEIFDNVCKEVGDFANTINYINSDLCKNPESCYQELNYNLEKFLSLENNLECFETCYLDENICENLERRQEIWNIFKKQYSAKEYEKDSFVIEQIQIISEMFDIVLSDDENGLLIQTSIEEQDYLDLDNEISKFEKQVNDDFFEYKVLFEPNFYQMQSEQAYKLKHDYFYDDVAYISSTKYYDKNECSRGNVSDVKLKDGVLYWKEATYDIRSFVEKKDKIEGTYLKVNRKKTLSDIESQKLFDKNEEKFNEIEELIDSLLKKIGNNTECEDFSKLEDCRKKLQEIHMKYAN